MSKSKSDVIKSLNEIKNAPIHKLKDDVVENSSGTNYIALAQYNAILDNITIGAHTNTTIIFADIEWKLRLLTSHEYIEIKKDVINQAKKDDLFDDWYTYYLLFHKILAKALTPSPFKLEGKAIFSEEDLKLINYDILEEVYKKYLHFVSLTTKKVEEFTEEEIQALINVVKKNPEILMDLDRGRLLTMSKYFLNYSLNLEKIIKPE